MAREFERALQKKRDTDASRSIDPVFARLTYHEPAPAFSWPDFIADAAFLNYDRDVAANHHPDSVHRFKTLAYDHLSAFSTVYSCECIEFLNKDPDAESSSSDDGSITDVDSEVEQLILAAASRD